MPIASKATPERTLQKMETTAWHFRFAEADQAGNVSAYRRFTDPRNVVATREPLTDFSVTPVWPAPLDCVDLVCTTDTAQKFSAWMTKPDDSQAVTTVAIETDSGKIRWRPGRGLIIGSAAECADLVTGLVEFSFFEGELRRLELAILPYQQSADRDVALAYNIRTADQSQWPRLYQTMEELYHLRLQFARLEPNLYQSPRALPAESRRVFQRLATRADIEARLEALNDRLETCEDLYEGAIDRITDYRNYRKGSLLEIGIIILLGLEVALLLFRH